MTTYSLANDNGTSSRSEKPECASTRWHKDLMTYSCSLSNS